MSPPQRRSYLQWLKRKADRQELAFHKTKRRHDRDAIQTETCWLTDADGNTVVTGDLAEIHRYLIGRPRA